MIQKLIDPRTALEAYKRLVFTATFFAGVFQVAFWIFRWVLISSCYWSWYVLTTENFFLSMVGISFPLYLTNLSLPPRFYMVGISCQFSLPCCYCWFMAGAAIIIGLQQLKGLLGIANFTHNTDIISVMISVFRGLNHNQVKSYSLSPKKKKKKR